MVYVNSISLISYTRYVNDASITDGINYINTYMDYIGYNDFTHFIY